MIPIIIPDKPVLAPLSWLTADLENEPAWHIQKTSQSNNNKYSYAQLKYKGSQGSTPTWLTIDT